MLAGHLELQSRSIITLLNTDFETWEPEVQNFNPSSRTHLEQHTPLEINAEANNVFFSRIGRESKFLTE